MGSCFSAESRRPISGSLSSLGLGIKKRKSTKKRLGSKNSSFDYRREESFLKAFKVMDRELRMHATIDCFFCGTTAVTLIKQVNILSLEMLATPELYWARETKMILLLQSS